MNIPKFKATCVEKNIDRKQLCFVWKCSLQTASNKSNGKTPITLEEAQRFSEYANLSDFEKVLIFLSDV